MSKELVLQSTVVNIGTTSTLLSAPRVRRYLIIENRGANVVHIHFGTAAATTSNGHRLAANERMEVRLPGEGNINAIAVTAASDVLITQD